MLYARSYIPIADSISSFENRDGSVGGRRDDSMHEIALVRDLVSVTLDAVQQLNARRVTRICVTVGYACDVVESLMQGL